MTSMEQSAGAYVLDKKLLVIESAHSLQYAIEAMERRRTRVTGVLRNGGFSGILTLKEARRKAAQGEDPAWIVLESIMTVHPVCIGPSCEMEDAFALMSENNLSHLPVVDHGQLIGIIDAEALRREMARAYHDLRRENRMMAYLWNEPYGICVSY